MAYQTQEIFEARTGYGQRNGTLTVFPGSPISFPTGASGFYGQQGTNQSNLCVSRASNSPSMAFNIPSVSNTYNLAQLSYPPVVGNNPALQPGGGPSLAISGEYSSWPSGRFAQKNFYTNI